MGVSNIATVTINVAAVNDAPVGVADSYTVGEDSTLNTTSGMPAGVLVNDTDAEGQALSAVFGGRTHQWCFGVGSNGTFTYTRTRISTARIRSPTRAFDGLAQARSPR